MQRNAALERLAEVFVGGWTIEGVLRVFQMTLDDATWTMSRTDPDFHQRFVARIEGDRMIARTEASEDRGATWRKDFDLVFERAR